MGLSLPHLALLALVVLVLFGRGRISEMMGDFGKGIKSFKEGMNDEGKPHDPAAPVLPAAQIAPPPANQATLNGETVIDGSSSTQPK